MRVAVELWETDIVTGRRTGLSTAFRRALVALRDSDVPFAVIGAAALGVRGLPRMTQDLDVVVLLEDAFASLDALERARFRSVAPIRRHEDPEPMYVMRDARGREVDVLVGAGEPESTVVAEAKRAAVLGVDVPVASLEHLLLMYLYSNQPKHLGDFARIVTDSSVELGVVERYLADVHPEMLPVFAERVEAARNPPPPPKRPRHRR